MSDGASGIPPSGGQIPSPDDTKKVLPKEKELDIQGSVGGEGEYEYAGFTFNDKKAYLVFKTKCITQMINEMIRQVKRDSDRMIKALRKMKEDQQ